LQLRQGKFQDRDMQCLIAVGRGRLAEAKQLIDGIPKFYSDRPQNLMSCPFALAVAQKDSAGARAMLAKAVADYRKNGGLEILIADNYRMLGDLKSAMPWYERAYQARDPLITFAPYEKYQTHDLAGYPPWKA